MDDIFGKRLKSLRLHKKMKQEDLAKLLDVSTSLIGMYERGKRSPSREMLQVLSGYFEVSTDYLLGVTDFPGKMQNMNNMQDLDYFLDQSSVMFKGKMLSDGDKKRIQDVLTALFFETLDERRKS